MSDDLFPFAIWFVAAWAMVTIYSVVASVHMLAFNLAHRIALFSAGAYSLLRLTAWILIAVGHDVHAGRVDDISRIFAPAGVTLLIYCLHRHCLDECGCDKTEQKH